ncbi:MAG: Fe-S protein assembly co-chaperone HscB [Bacteroidetes bacterium]|nr:MAG: Fe-S protein assembly co-chaperone HscB [Bacteroidota bacterium]
MNYFEFYDIPVSFQVDEPTLRRIYYRNSKQYHPDYHTLSDDDHQAEMLELSTLNNKAFQTLSDPDKRMRYILQINGLLEEEGKQQVPQDFLMDMMDINEAIMELELDFDQQRYEDTLQAVRNLETELQESIQPVLDGYSGQPGETTALQAVLEYFLKKRYLLRIHENLARFAPR